MSLIIKIVGQALLDINFFYQALPDLLTQKGSKFICLNDSSTRLIDYCRTLKENAFVAIKNGADAIIEGLEIFTKQL